ncbi:RNA polymerase sigma factor [Horticoccus sp. 23ND18S-11]|uniref:RNA polymerase sigma factor n=1 Tax=Horticoccus sp. 23ND18S-11 TaxID=3391832 RepID=UPI0039C8EF16
MIAPSLSLPSFLLPTQGSDQPAVSERAEKSAASRREALHDAELVRRFNAGEESVFVEIMTRHRERIFAIALSLLRNRADAEEIAQDTFIRAHRALPRFRGDSSLATWLHRIVVNLARNRYWYFFRRRRHATVSLDCALTDDSSVTFADVVATDAPTPARAAANGEFSALVTACMEKLDARHREILRHRNLLNRSYEEIASALGINVGTVKSRIARARANLRSLIAKTCPEFDDDAAPSDWFETNRATGRVSTAAA